MIRFAREQWERNKKCSPAMKPSEGTPFYIFLEDLVEYVDREWSYRFPFKGGASCFFTLGQVSSNLAHYLSVIKAH